MQAVLVAIVLLGYNRSVCKIITFYIRSTNFSLSVSTNDTVLTGRSFTSCSYFCIVLKQFEQDMNQLFTNCLEYNGPGNGKCL